MDGGWLVELQSVADALQGHETAAAQLIPRASAIALVNEEKAFVSIFDRELHGYAPNDEVGVPAPDAFLSRMALPLLEAKLAQIATASPLNAGQRDVAQVMRTVEREQLRAIITMRRSYLAARVLDLAKQLNRAADRWVMSIHGIQTRGTWQKELSRHITNAGLKYHPLDYNWFDVFRLLLPSSRDRRVDEFRDEYDRFVEAHQAVPSIIAHSFGTLILTRAIEKYSLRFDRIVLCGSIVRRDYSWSSQLNAVPPRVSRVLNDFGGRDVWARMAVWFIKDAGQSGVSPFHDDADGRVVQRGNHWLRHSDYFYVSNYTNRWIPFVLGSDPTPSADDRASTPNWRFAITIAVATSILLSLLWWRLR